ncbi:type IV pilus biogenesis protein EbsA [Oscillatoria sp. HE19RPO]|uniref:type IV pilus biogenesis protein EbsA n=1 Tax=Oscillatoria sp. HE19RPO TaxID=2954806 RepID=UPI0020C432F2|nr:type IV pilus biogenesis protein EbsA [Oscillatoria sp. HE19RPO]
MGNNLDQLQPADNREIGVYIPYYQGNKRAVLPRAISLYRQGNLEGERKIEGGENIPFVASWHVSSLPADLTRCRIQFDGNADLSYEVTMANFEFIDHLIDVIISHKRYHSVDFSKGFYRKLLLLDD